MTKWDLCGSYVPTADITLTGRIPRLVLNDGPHRRAALCAASVQIADAR